jgi:L,D-transpeptidase YbiS
MAIPLRPLGDRGRRWRRWARAAGFVAVALLVASAALALLGGAYRATPFPAAAELRPPSGAAADPQRQAQRAWARLQGLAPRGAYIVVDTYRNKLRLYRDGALVRDALCSTGSGIVLRDPRNGRQWVFDTPMGERRIQRKVKNPIWAKPDWAFIEEGFVPPQSARERFDDFSLGDYGLYMGDGYIIHGTIFQTLLGQRVTHGCVRLGDADLELVYRTVPVGSRVYLY